MMLMLRINKPMTTLFSFIFIDLDIILQFFFSLKSLSVREKTKLQKIDGSHFKYMYMYIDFKK